MTNNQQPDPVRQRMVELLGNLMLANVELQATVDALKEQLKLAQSPVSPQEAAPI